MCAVPDYVELLCPVCKETNTESLPVHLTSYFCCKSFIHMGSTIAYTMCVLCEAHNPVCIELHGQKRTAPKRSAAPSRHKRAHVCDLLRLLLLLAKDAVLPQSAGPPAGPVPRCPLRSALRP